MSNTSGLLLDPAPESTSMPAMIPPTRRRNLLIFAGIAVAASAAAYFGHQYKKQHDHEAVVAKCDAGEPAACSKLCNNPETPSASACLKTRDHVWRRHGDNQRGPSEGRPLLFPSM